MLREESISELDKLKLNVRAINFVIVSFEDFSSNDERIEYLRSQFDNVPFLKLYVDLSKEQLNVRIDKFMDKEEMLLQMETLILRSNLSNHQGTYAIFLFFRKVVLTLMFTYPMKFQVLQRMVAPT